MAALAWIAGTTGGCNPPNATPDASKAAQASDAAHTPDSANAPDASSTAPSAAPDASSSADPAANINPDINPDIAEFERLCDLAIQARHDGKMGDAKLAWVAEQFAASPTTKSTSQVKSLLKTMQSVPAANRCLLLQTGARKAGLEQDQLCTALCPMIRYEEAALKEVKLPVSSSDIWASREVAHTIVASPTVVRVGKLAVVPIFEGQIAPAFKDVGVVRALDAVLDLLPTSNPGTQGEVASLVVDASVGSSVLIDLMATLEANGAKRFELMLQGGGKLDEISPTVEANQLTDDAIQPLRWRKDPPPQGAPRVQVWADEFGVLVTAWGADGAEHKTLLPKCQRSVCSLEAEHPLAQVDWIGVYNALLAAKQHVGPDHSTVEVATSHTINVEILTKLADVARYQRAPTPNATAGEPIPSGSPDALRSWHIAKDPQGALLPLLNDLVLTSSAEVSMPGPPSVSGLEVKGLPAAAHGAVNAEAFYLRSCFVKHGKGLATPGHPYMVMTTLSLSPAGDGTIIDSRFMEMSTASGTVPPDLQTCWLERLRRQRYTASDNTLRFLMSFD